MTPYPKIEPLGRYSGAQAIAALGIGHNTFYRWLREGRIVRRYGRNSTRPHYLGSDLLKLWQNY